MLFEFDALIKRPEKFPHGAYVDIPFSVQETFGSKGQVKIVATFDGISYRGSLSPIGGGKHMLMLRKDIRNQIGKAPGDTVKVTLKKDTEPRTVKVPDDFQALLEQNPAALTFFQKLSYTHRKEYVRWITGAKRASTRERRLHKSIERLLTGKKGI